MFLLASAGRGEPSDIGGEGMPQLTDDMGKPIVAGKASPRIVSLYAGHTENLIAIGARDLIVAIGHEDGGFELPVPVLGVKPGMEQLAALEPDVVLTRPMMARSQGFFYDALESFGMSVVALDPPKWDDFGRYIKLLGLVSGIGDEAEKTAAAIMGETASKTGGKEGLSVFLVTNGRTMATCTPDSWAARVIETSGFRNAARGAVSVAKGSVIAAFGAERLLASDGEIDVVLLQQGAMNTTRAEDFMNDPRFSSMRAVKNGMIFDVPEEDISRPSLLRLRGAVRTLRELISSRGWPNDRGK
ncbi:MAG: ABC transporter substrate-binding protein [Synergistaceae bacterium]|nr:ABC transporter substrate-binding protein [Synergistaceae bacterium]